MIRCPGLSTAVPDTLYVCWPAVAASPLRSSLTARRGTLARLAISLSVRPQPDRSGDQMKALGARRPQLLARGVRRVLQPGDVGAEDREAVPVPGAHLLPVGVGGLPCSEQAPSLTCGVFLLAVGEGVEFGLSRPPGWRKPVPGSTFRSSLRTRRGDQRGEDVGPVVRPAELNRSGIGGDSMR